MPQLERVLRYLDFVAKPKPLPVLLDEAPRQIAACLGAEVVSLYLREGDGTTLVMRGNVGLDPRAPGRVRLRVGEGITGRAVAIRRPIAAASAADHENFHGIPGLGEEPFPAFVAVPVLGDPEPLGAVVLQRAQGPWLESEISLAAALTAPIAAGIRHARVLDDLRQPKRATRGARKVTLTGVPAHPGFALGAIAALRRPAEAAAEDPQEGDLERFREALETARTTLATLATEAGARPEVLPYVQSHQLMLEDQRLQRLTVEALRRGESLARALRHVVGDATKAAADRGDPFSLERARGLEQLCDALRMMASPDPGAALPARALVVADDLGIYDLLVTARAQPAGFVLGVPPRDAAAAPEHHPVLLQLLGVPALVDVAGIHRWASPGDIALLDGHYGLLVVNPSRADIATYRASRRKARRAPPA
ncbi:MAG: phosphoenolpyruvate-utilizing N-terminal domain-containing protein [Myxococcota bacterium]